MFRIRLQGVSPGLSKLFMFSVMGGLLVLSPGCQKKEVPEGPTNVVVIEITASDCRVCSEVHNIIQSLRDHYQERVTFATVDVTDSISKLHALEAAHDFHGELFVKTYENRPGTVGILNKRDGEQLGLLEKDRDSAHYQEKIEEAIRKLSE